MSLFHMAGDGDSDAEQPLSNIHNSFIEIWLLIILIIGLVLGLTVEYNYGLIEHTINYLYQGEIQNPC